MYGLFPLSFCPLRPFHTGPYVSPPSLSRSLSGLNASLSSVRQFWTPSILVLAVSAAQSRERASHLRADRWCRRQLVDGFWFFYCPSLFSLLHFFWDLFPFLFSFLSTHLSQPVCRFSYFFLSLRPLSQVECNLQQIWWSPKIREHDLVLWLRWVLAPVFCYFNLLLLKSTLWLFFLCIHQQNLSSIAVDLVSLACQIVACCCVAGLW